MNMRTKKDQSNKSQPKREIKRKPVKVVHERGAPKLKLPPKKPKKTSK